MAEKLSLGRQNNETLKEHSHMLLDISVKMDEYQKGQHRILQILENDDRTGDIGIVKQTRENTEDLKNINTTLKVFKSNIKIIVIIIPIVLTLLIDWIKSKI